MTRSSSSSKLFLRIGTLIVFVTGGYFTFETSSHNVKAALLYNKIDERGLHTKTGPLYQGTRRRGERIPLDILTDEGGQHVECPPNTKAVFNNPATTISNSEQSSYKIPLVIHQGCKSRCISEKLYDLTTIWKALGIPYYFHDDAAVDRLVYSGRFPEFPHMQLAWEHCIIKPVVKSDLWRMLLLYEYGGIYADLDSTPVTFLPLRNILPDDEMYALAQPDHLPTFHFLASMPRHSLSFLTVQQQLSNLLFASDTGVYNPAIKTGPGAIKTAITLFSKDDGEQLQESGKIDSGNFTFSGINGQTMRREGFFTESKAIVNPCAFKKNEKVAQFGASNITHYTSSYGSSINKSGKSCFEMITAHYSNDT